MLRLCTKGELGQYIDFAFALASDPEKSGYPTYCDGIKTKDMFIRRTYEAFARETEELLLFELDGEVQGLIHYYWIPEDHYLQTCLFLTNKEAEQALSEFLAYVGERFHGCDLYLGFPADNLAAVHFLTGHGFACIENDYNNTAFLERLEQLAENDSIIRISEENYQSFQSLHGQIEGDMYWNSERIRKDLDQWGILVKEADGKAMGAAYYKDLDDGWFELFGIALDQDICDPALFKELLRAALLDAKSRGGAVMTFFCEEEYEEAAKECGFCCVGKYLCYKSTLA